VAEPAVTEPAVTEPAVTEPAVTEPAVTGRAAAGRAAAEPVRALFDAKAATWTAKYAPGGALTARRARLAAAVSARAGHGERVLDLGCGSGDLARHLAEAGLRVTGCDISARMLEQAERADPAGTWVTLDPAWRELPFAAGAFSAVIASSVLEYVSDPAAVLRECARVLTPGGALLCTVPDIRHPVRWLEWLAARCAAPVAPLLAPRSAAASGGPVRGSRLRSYVDRVTVGVSGAGRVRGGQRRRPPWCSDPVSFDPDSYCRWLLAARHTNRICRPRASFARTGLYLSTGAIFLVNSARWLRPGLATP
jgi:SAM-dependent methyltransferase